MKLINNTANNAKSISILGCGWLGLPLAATLTSMQYDVMGSTTNADKLDLLKSYAIRSFLIDYNTIQNKSVTDAFYNSELLFLNIPPKIRSNNGERYLENIHMILNHVQNSTIKKIIHISSTSVYPDVNKEVLESDVTSLKQADNKIIFEAEELIRNAPNLAHIILRCGGLTGYDRMLIKHFAGKKNLEGGASPVNLIHRDDVIGIVIKLIEQNNCWNQTINICAPMHPTREVFYQKLAADYSYDMPHFSVESTAPYKIINTSKLDNLLDYDFIYPDPLFFKY